MIIIHLKQAIIVEGKYDKIKLKSIFDAVIIQTDGFRIYKDKEKMAIIRHYAAATGIIILTDSDSAGFKIRNYLKGAVKGKITNVYIPDIFGKERRKNTPSKEGKLGVEGIDINIITEAFSRAGIDISGEDAEYTPPEDPITRMDMFELGLSGGEGSSDKRRILLKHFGLPELLTTGGMVEILNTMITREQLYNTAEDIFYAAECEKTEEK